MSGVIPFDSKNACTLSQSFADLCDKGKSFASCFYFGHPSQPGFIPNLVEVSKNGMAIAKVPFLPDKATVEIFDEILSIVETLPTPILFVCTGNVRASAVVLVVEAKKKSWSVAEAFVVATRLGLAFLKNVKLKEVVAKSIHKLIKPNALLLRQLYDVDTKTCTYLLADLVSKEAVLIDAVEEKLNRDVALIKQLGLRLLYAIDTHVHADHITSSGFLQDKIGCKIAVAAASRVPADLHLKDGDSITFGTRSLVVRSTPGHTDACISLIMDDISAVFTGDTLLCRGVGRTDFQSGSSVALFENVHTKLFTLPGFTIVYPGHDYNGLLSSSIAEEVEFNEDVGGGITKDSFIGTMAELKLNPPIKLEVAVPRNMRNGR